MGSSNSIARAAAKRPGASTTRTTAAPTTTTATPVTSKNLPKIQNGPISTNTGYQPLAGKVYTITGGASGIGLATAKLLSQRGATICIADVDAQAMKKAEAYFEALDVSSSSSSSSSPSPTSSYMVTQVDVSKRSEVDAWIDLVVKTYGRLDGAANVAGVIGKQHGIATVDQLEDVEWDRIIAVNLTGAMYCMRAQLRNIAEGGSIVNVSSIHGLKGFARHAAYDASKHGLIGLTKAAALENGAREIRVNSVAPGAIYTPLMQKSWDFFGRPADAPFDDPSAFQRQGTAEETAAVIGFLLGPESTFVSGSVYSVDGAWV